MLSSRPIAPALATLLLTVAMAGVGCERPAGVVEARRQWVEEATAMEPLPGARERPAKAPAPAPPPVEPVAAGEEEAPPLDVLVDLLVEVSTQNWALADFVDEVRSPEGGCAGKIERVGALLERANARTIGSTDRFIELVPRYTAEQQQEAARRATEVFGQEVERGQAHLVAQPLALEAFRNDCPGQVPVMASLRRKRVRVVQHSILRARATGLVLPPGLPAGAAP